MEAVLPFFCRYSVEIFIFCRVSVDIHLVWVEWRGQKNALQKLVLAVAMRHCANCFLLYILVRFPGA